MTYMIKKLKSDMDRYKTWLPRLLSTSNLACQDEVTALTTYLCKEDEKQDHSFLSLCSSSVIFAEYWWICVPPGSAVMWEFRRDNA